MIRQAGAIGGRRTSVLSLLHTCSKMALGMWLPWVMGLSHSIALYHFSNMSHVPSTIVTTAFLRFAFGY